MHPRPSSAVYKCIIPVKKPITTSGAIYHSLFRQPREGVPYPAWPEIDDPFQPCCLPTLPDRGVYFYHRPSGDEFIEIASRVAEYWNTVVDREIYQHISAMLDTHVVTAQPMLELGWHPQLFFGTDYDNDFKMKLGNSVERFVEAIVQGLIYGNLKNFHGVEEAFAYAHELTHCYAGNLYCGRVLDELSTSAHKTLKILASEESLSRGEIAKLWEEFWRTNDQIKSLVHKFEPIEEIFATYLGLRFLPTEVRNTVKPMVKEAMEKKNWYKAYEAFTEACDNVQEELPYDVAAWICDWACRTSESIEVDSTDLLYKLSKIVGGSIDESGSANVLEEAVDPAKVYWSVLKMYEDTVGTIQAKYGDSLEDILNDRKQQRLLQAYIFNPQVWLFGQYPEKYINPIFYLYVPEPDYGDNLSPRESVFYESVRQQLSKKCGFVCPFCVQAKTRCLYKERIQRLYEQLPEEYKNYFHQTE